MTAAVDIETPQAAAARFLASLHHPSHILVGISGGSDSTGLLVALAAQIGAADGRHRLSAATVDHGLRPEAADEAREVAAVCAGLGIAHYTSLWADEKPATGLMAAARAARYTLLADVAAAIGADLIVTAHTVDDQRETLAMRNARAASGRAALQTGIADAVLFDRRIWVVRPFLRCRRADIRADLAGRGLGWIDDPSNLDMHYERVRVRAGLAADAPQTADSASGALMGAGEARGDLSALSADWLDKSVLVHAGLLCRIDHAGLDAAAPAFAYGLSLLAATFGGQPFAPGHERMRRILSFVAAGEPGRRTAGGVVFDLRRDGLYLMRESRNIAALRLAPGESGVWDGRFSVSNGSHRAVQIVAAAATAPVVFPDGTPRGAAMRANAAAPAIVFEPGQGPADGAAVAIMPHLAPFDRFLTRFDLIFADRLAKCFARTSYLSPPL